MTTDPIGSVLVCVFLIGVIALTWAQGKINDIMRAEIDDHRRRIEELEGVEQ